MKKLVFSATVLALFCLPAEAGMQVDPPSLDFGCVEWGSSASDRVTLTGTNGTPFGGFEFLYAVVLSGAEWFLVTALPAPQQVPPGASVDVEITFAPNGIGIFEGSILLFAVNGVSEQAVPLTGLGRAACDVGGGVADLLDWFDAAVESGCLVGNGTGRSAEGRLKALRNKIEAAGELFAEGELASVCDQLDEILHRTDGQHPPPDFVADGDACEDPALENATAELFETVSDLLILAACF